MLLSTTITLITIFMLALLLSPRVRKHRPWQATVTPLASIIGSGFLVVSPLLHEVAGILAPLVMLAIVLIAGMLGWIIRYNIRHLEPILRRRPPRDLAHLEKGGDISLFLAYVISVSFYLSLLAAFLLRFSPETWRTDLINDVVTSIVLLFIGWQGWRGGLSRLEMMEEYSVSIKLAIITALLFALAVFFIQNPFNPFEIELVNGGWVNRVRLIAGTMLVIQGFETSRYLGHSYDRETRCRSMANAQLITGLIYVIFVALMMPLLYLNGPIMVSETAIIDLSIKVASVLAPLLLMAAVMSQFSAAVADTLGAGGIAQEVSNDRINHQLAYPAIALVAIILVWLTDVFEIISLASRAFALYYFVQCILALKVMRREKAKWRVQLMAMCMALLMLIVILFAIPIEG